MSSGGNPIATVTCSSCGLQARYRPNPDGLYTIEFDASQFSAKCKKPNAARSFDCLELNLAIMMAGRREPAKVP